MLNDLGIPHATLLDLDLGRRHGGANIIRSVVASLASVGIDLRESLEHDLGLIDVDDMAAIDDASLVAGVGSSFWLQALQDTGVSAAVLHSEKRQLLLDRSGPRWDRLKKVRCTMGGDWAA